MEPQPKDSLEAAVVWVRKRFSSAYYPYYTAPDGKPKYLEVTVVRGSDGVTLTHVVQVYALADILRKSVSGFEARRFSEVKAALKEVSQKRGLGLEPLLKRMNGRGRRAPRKE